jgi:uncharacterized protein YndB with AHSA1/START domain
LRDHPPRRAVVTRFVDAEPSIVWEALTRPEQLEQWFAPGDLGAKVFRFDLHVGGAFELAMVGSPDDLHHASGTFVEILPERRLVMAWRWRDFPLDTGDTRVTIELAGARGGTRLTVTHESLASADSERAHQEGWKRTLAHLDRLLAGRRQEGP